MLTLGRLLSERPKCGVYKDQPLRWIEVKEDGKRLSFYKDDRGVIRAVGRKLHIDDWSLLRHQKWAKEIMCLPNETFIDGELHPADRRINATMVPSLLNEGEGLAYTPFAIPLIAGTDQRFCKLQFIREQIEAIGFEPPRLFTPIPGFGPAHYINIARSNDWEGFVIKESHWFNWFKLKPTKSVDCIITGFKEGTSKYRGSLGALEVSLFLPQGPSDFSDVLRSQIPDYAFGEIASVGGGFSDILRKEIWDHQDCYLHRVVEVEYDKVETHNRLRFPRFVRFRNDKPMEECTADQLIQEDEK